MEKENIKRYSHDQVKNMIAKGDYVPTKKDAPEYEIDPGFWDNAKLVKPTNKRSVHLRVDEDVLKWFKSQGSGHLTRDADCIKIIL